MTGSPVTEFSGVLVNIANGSSSQLPRFEVSLRLTQHLLRLDLNELWRFVHEHPETLSEAR